MKKLNNGQIQLNNNECVTPVCLERNESEIMQDKSDRVAVTEWRLCFCFTYFSVLSYDYKISATVIIFSLKCVH